MKRWELEGFPNATIAKAHALLNSERRSFRVVGRVMMAKGRIELKNNQIDQMYDVLNDKIDDIKYRASKEIDKRLSPKAKAAIMVATVIVIMGITFYATKDTSDIPGYDEGMPKPSSSDSYNTSDDDMEIGYEEKKGNTK